MLHHPTLLAPILIAALSSYSAAASESRDATLMQEPLPAQISDPMASFARLVGGEWRVTFAGGASAFHAWHWGPGKHSLSKMTHGFDAAASSWAGEVLYWHPGLGQVRMLSLHGDIPGVGRGVAEGVIRFEGETSDAVVDLHQPSGRRKLGNVLTFDGPDKYHESLLEDVGAGLQPLNEWRFVRTHERSGAQSRPAERAPPQLPERLKAFEALVDSTWEATGASVGGNAFRIRSKLEWIADLEVVFARITATRGDGEPIQLLEAYVYHHVGTSVLRCLVLSDRGGVHEGDVTVPDQRALQLDLKDYEGDRVVPRMVRFDLGNDGDLRTRVWSLEGAARTLTLDLLHEKIKSKPS